MDAYRTEKIETPAGIYTVELHYDDMDQNPLTDWDQEGMAFFVVGSRHGEMVNTLDEVTDATGNAIRTWIADEHHVDDIQRRFALWRAITGSPWVLVTGDDYDMDQAYGWMVLVDTSTTYVASDGNSYPSLPQPVGVAEATMKDFHTWVNGEVCGFVVKDPAGNDLTHGGSVWGFYDEADALQQGIDEAKADAAERVNAANLAGAGIVGLI